MIKELCLLFKNPLKVIRPLGARGFFNWLSDKAYLKLVYRSVLGKKLNLGNPKTYNEKLQWLKLNDRKPEYSKYVDKYAVRSYISETIGEQYLIPLIGVYDSVKDINWDSLPDQFVLKCTHGSGTNIICNNKAKFDIKSATKKLKQWMKKNWYWYGREWPYKKLKPRIICEELLQENITDYKFMCFNGEPKLIQIHQNRNSENQSLDFYDISWNKTEIRRNKKTNSELIQRPGKLDEMIDIARKLSKNEIHVRIDLYEVNGKVYFGEKTYYSASGFSPFIKDEYDLLLGSWIRITQDKNI